MVVSNAEAAIRSSSGSNAIRDAQRTTGTNWLTTSGGLPLSTAVKIFFRVPARGLVWHAQRYCPESD